MDTRFVGALLVTAVVFIGIFLLLREFFCWYWKINERVSLMRENNSLLRQGMQLEGSGSSRRTVVAVSQSPASSGSTDNVGVPAPEAPAAILSDEELMTEHGITFDGEKYHYGDYRYDRLQDAINYAARQ